MTDNDDKDAKEHRGVQMEEDDPRNVPAEATPDESMKHATKGRRSRAKRSKPSSSIANEGASMQRSEPEKTSVPPATTPLSDRPARNRKSVNRFAESMELEKVRKFEIEQGAGACLKDIPNVVFRLSKRKGTDEIVQLLHKLLYGKRVKPHNAKPNILQFSGYVWITNEEKEKVKLKEKLDKCVKDKLLQIGDILDLNFSKATTKKEDVVMRLVEFLECPGKTSDKLLEKAQEKSKGKLRKKTPTKRSRKKASEQGPRKREDNDAGPSKTQQIPEKDGGSDGDESEEDEDTKEEPVKKKRISKKMRNEKQQSPEKDGQSDRDKSEEDEDTEEEPVKKKRSSKKPRNVVHSKKSSSSKVVPTPLKKNLKGKGSKQLTAQQEEVTSNENGSEEDYAARVVQDEPIKKKGRSSKNTRDVQSVKNTSSSTVLQRSTRKQSKDLKRRRDEDDNEEDNVANEGVGKRSSKSRRGSESEKIASSAKEVGKPVKTLPKASLEASKKKDTQPELPSKQTTKKASSYNEVAVPKKGSNAIEEVTKKGSHITEVVMPTSPRKENTKGGIDSSKLPVVMPTSPRKENTKGGIDSSKLPFGKKSKENQQQCEDDVLNGERSKEEDPSSQVEPKEESNRADPVLPADEELRAAIYELLKDADFSTVTFTDIVSQLGKKFGTDLSHDKAHIKVLLQEEMSKLADEDDQSDNDSGIDEDA